ncbi:ATP synthase F1 subunit delta [Flavobacterium sp. CYK-4]|uniref:ATP synthase F1 subunit delta n=1 Tax=Flavobacterium lotistagni TaxID=2709660 RepID=UPI00140AB494|nr:ATP synthase F1 subunit delta [Flavobacterium lotistagni]NHM07804.1 ATP synthase F1 subunit delta [Flavobacterium lotistagni]
MAGTRAAIRYAKAILDIAHSKGVATEVNNDMALIASTIGNNAELNTFIQSPTTGVEVKNSAVSEVFSGINGVTKNLFQLLHDNKRFEILSDVATEYNKQFEAMNGMEKAIVTTAVPMDAELESKVLAKILTFSNKKVIIENIVDPAIIGGFILRIGDQQYNASIANRLQVLKRELSN